MKALPFNIPKPKNEALVYQEDYGRLFYGQLHQHKEIQISFIVEGEGTLIVGDSITTYSSGDVVVIGSYLPHVFRSDSLKTKRGVMYTLFFAEDSFGPGFFNLPDLDLAQVFLNKSALGIRVLGDKEGIFRIFHGLSTQNKVNRIASLLQLISLIVQAEHEPLSSFGISKGLSDDEGKRMGGVYTYVMEHFADPIQLATVASCANMSKNAFCRYFKKRTNKTFFEFLTEVRIGHASKQLLDHPELPVGLIAESAGFRSIANFHKMFRRLKGCSPRDYRAKYTL